MNAHASVSASEATPLDATAQRLTSGFRDLDLVNRLAEARRAIAGRLVFTTSFGLEDQAITHAILSQDLAIDIVTLDSGRLFPQTYALWSETEARYGHRIQVFYPERASVEAFVTQHGIDGFRASIAARQACCAVRKVVPLGRALDGASGWIAGVRAEQSGERATTPYAAVDPARGLIKLNPLLDWSRERVVAYVHEHGIPYNPLHDEGFLSIGCAPCTRAVKPGEPERAGRWWWEQEDKKDCGLHSPPILETAVGS
jgi:phosphoadenosine phosphosulfate reductase